MSEALRPRSVAEAPDEDLGRGRPPRLASEVSGHVKTWLSTYNY